MGWMDLARLTDDETGGLQLGNFFTRSINRRSQNPGAADPIGNTRLPRAQEAPITSMTETWQPHKNRRTMEAFETPAMTDYLKHIQNVPKREDYSPSIWHRIVGSIGGAAEGGTRGALAGMKTALDINEIPYRRAREDYELKGAGLESAAKLEEAGNRNRNAYLKSIMEQDEADKDREVKWANSEISRIKADASIKRLAILDEIKKSTNEATVQRLQNQLARFDQEHQEAIDRLEVAKMNAGANQTRANAAVTSANAAATNAGANVTRANAYANRQTQLTEPKQPTAAQIGITRRIIEEEIMNENPNWLNNQGVVRPENRQEYEMEIQRRLRRRIQGYGNIPLGPDGPAFMGDIDDDNPYEVIQ